MIKKVSKDRVASDQAPISSTRSFVVEEEEEENVRFERKIYRFLDRLF